jgi:hypothetical protein
MLVPTTMIVTYLPIKIRELKNYNNLSVIVKES